MVRGDFSRVWRLFGAFLLLLLGAGTGEFLTGVEAGRPRDEADEKAAELARGLDDVSLPPLRSLQ